MRIPARRGHGSGGASIPHDGSLESGPAVLREGYLFVSNRCRRLGTDAFETRLGRRPTVCMLGEEAARTFYERPHTRVGALPKPIQTLLQDEGSVQVLDAAPHRRRKELFLDLAGPGASRELAAAFDDRWDELFARRPGRGAFALLPAVEELLCRTVCAWAGVPLGEAEAHERTSELVAMIDGAGSRGPRNWRGHLLRRRTERWAGGGRVCAAAAGSERAALADARRARERRRARAALSAPRPAPPASGSAAPDRARRYVAGRGAEAGGALTGGAAPLDVLFEAAGLPAADVPEPLARLYGGELGFEEPRVVANFVETIDGVVAIPSLPRSNRVVSGDSAEDRFVMGLLRAFADAVVVGSGTLAGAPRGIWTPEAAHPAGAGAFAELRARLGKPPLPELAVLTATGAVAPGHRAVEAGLLVVTNDQGAERLRGTLPRASEIVSLGPDRHVDPRAALGLLRSRGHRLILAEAGPHLFGSLLRERLVDELFLTVAPLIAGRAGLDGRLALVEEAHLVPETPVDGRLLSVRRSGSHLFLRYEL